MPDRRETEFEREFRNLYCRHSAFVRCILLRFRVPPASLDDVAQEVFLTVLKKLPGFERRADIKTWLFAICRYKAKDERRRAYYRYEQPVAEPEVPSAAAAPHHELEQRFDPELLDRALSRLSEAQRQVFVRRVLEGESVAEIASGLGCSPFTIYTRLSAATRKLQTFVEKRSGVAGWLMFVRPAGERVGLHDEGARAARGLLRRRAWYRPLLEGLFPVVAALSVVMTPLPSGAPTSRVPAPAVIATAVPEPEPEPEQDGIVVPAATASTSLPVAPPPEPQRRARQRVRRTKPTELDPHALAPDEPEAPAPPVPAPEREQEILWRSRFALDTNPEKAFALAEEHAAAYPAGLLTEDREVLAIEALLRLRRRSSALERARRFATAYPHSPYARPVRQLIERLSLPSQPLSVADSR